MLLLSTLLSALLPIALSAQLHGEVRKEALTGAEVNGVWSSGNRTWRLLILPDDRLQFDFQGIYSYIGSDSERTVGYSSLAGIVPVVGNTATISRVFESSECLITLTLIDGTLEVKQDGLCGFHKDVTADGAYKWTSPYVTDEDRGINVGGPPGDE